MVAGMGATGPPAEFWINGVVLSAVAFVGILGNLATVLLLSTKRIRPNSTYNNLLKWLAAIDCLFLVSCFFTFSLQHLNIFYSQCVLCSLPDSGALLLPLQAHLHE